MENTEKPFWQSSGKYVIELLMMFLGVYAAFMLDNYRNNQETKQKEKQYLILLAKELNKQIEELNIAEISYTRKSARIKLIIDCFEKVAANPTLLDTIQKYSHHFIGNFWNSGFSNTAVEAMQTSGGFGLVSDPDLVFDVVSYKNACESSAGQIQILLDQLKSSGYSQNIRPYINYKDYELTDKRVALNSRFQSEIALLNIEINSFIRVLKKHNEKALLLKQKLAAHLAKL